MHQYLLRPAKRFAVLIPGLIIAYICVRDIFPYFDRKLPLGLAILVTYIIGAYLLVPALLRAYRIFVPVEHLPLYCVTPDGFASDPLNIGIVGTRRQVITAMQGSGWHMADPHKLRYLMQHGLSILLGTTYSNAPVSNLYLFGRKQDLAFQIPTEGVASRHHVRFWATTYNQTKKFSVRSIHWHHRSEHVKDDDLLWVGAASLDVGVAFIRHNMQVTHMIDPDTDQERELIVNNLSEQKLIDSIETIKLEKPYRIVNRVWRGHLQTDGKMSIVKLKQRSIGRRSRNHSR